MSKYVKYIKNYRLISRNVLQSPLNISRHSAVVVGSFDSLDYSRNLFWFAVLYEMSPAAASLL